MFFCTATTRCTVTYENISDRRDGLQAIIHDIIAYTVIMHCLEYLMVLLPVCFSHQLPIITLSKPRKNNEKTNLNFTILYTQFVMINNK